MTTALALSRAGAPLVIERGNPEFEATCAFMAREYAEATAEIRRLAAALDAQSERLYDAFKSELTGCSYNPFELTLAHNHARHHDKVDAILNQFKRRAWEMLFDRVGIKKVMSVAKRAAFEKRLKEGDIPEITEDALIDVILSMADNAADFAKDAAKEVFEILRPSRGDYKTNSAFRIGRRVILTYFISPAYSKGKFRVSYSRESQLIAVDGVFHILDGKGIMSDRKGPLAKAIEESPDGKGETDYFRFKCFRNNNLHLEFKRLDLVKQLNFLGVGEHVLGTEEM